MVIMIIFLVTLYDSSEYGFIQTLETYLNSQFYVRFDSLKCSLIIYVATMVFPDPVGAHMIVLSP